MVLKKIEASLSGVHSRAEETIRISRDFERGRASGKELGDAFARDTDALIALQRSEGFDLISSGQITWPDAVTPIFRAINGLEIGSDLSRWYNTNTFHLKLSVANELSFSEDSAKQLVSWGNREPGEINGRAVFLIGPYTLASLVKDNFYRSKAELVEQFSRVLAKIIEHLSKLGVSCVYLNEPSIVYAPTKPTIDDLCSTVGSYIRNLSNLPVKLRVHTYFGDATEALPYLLSLPAEMIGVDFTQTPLEKVRAFGFKPKSIGIGCINARNSLLETPQWVADFAISAAEAVGAENAVILPSSELKYLPREHADKKLRVLAEAARSVRRKIVQ